MYQERLSPTCDSDVWIEAQSPGYIRYVASSGERWEVRGFCDRRGDCMVGAVVGGELIDTAERAREVALTYTGPDCPVRPGFSGCCPLECTTLPPQES